MILSIARILFVGCTLALWLALGMPSGAFFAEAWIPSVAWLILGALAVASGRLSRMLAVDEDTYGMVSLALGSIVPIIGALLAAVALFVARYIGVGDESSGSWATSPILGAFFVLLLMATFVPLVLFQDRTIGARGTTPIVDNRGTMQSNSPAPRSAEEFQRAQESQES